MHPILHVGGFAIPTYGIFAAAGWIVAICLWTRLLPHMRLRGGDRELWHVIYVLLGGGLVGGKLLALVDYRAAGTEALLANLSSGFVYLGGVIGAFLGAAIFCSVRRYAFFDLADYFVSGGALGHAIGRVGCFLSGCCHGSPTTLAWGVTFTKPNAGVPPEALNVAVHPTQLLEAGGELAIFFLIHFHFLRRRIAGRIAPGVTALIRLAAYGALRFSVDFLRGDDPDFRLGSITVSQSISLAVIAMTVWYSARLMRSFRRAATGR